MKEVTGEWREIHNKKLHNVYSSSNIMRVIKSRRMTFVKMTSSHSAFLLATLLLEASRTH
jgi:hypothetical protein